MELSPYERQSLLDAIEVAYDMMCPPEHYGNTLSTTLHPHVRTLRPPGPRLCQASCATSALPGACASALS